MLVVGRFGVNSIASLVFTALLLVLPPNQSYAGKFEDALTLVRSGDIEKIEQTFAAHYEAFAAGELDNDDFIEPYAAFYTLDLPVLDMIAEWRAAYPDSAHARVAEAGPKMHLAIVLRGETTINLVPRRSLERARGLWSEARTLYSEALDIAPRHVKAAHGLKDAAQYLGDDAAALRAKRVVAVYGWQIGLLFNEIHESTPQWGGSEATMRRLCDTVAPKLEGLSVEECHAKATLMLWDQSREVRDAAIDVLRRENPDRHRWTIARELLDTGRGREALAMYDERNAWISGSLADDFARALDNYAVQERIVDRWLAVNPLTPRHLVMKSEAQGIRGDFEGAAETIEKAMVYGETIPEVRDMRLAAMMHDKRRHEHVLAEFEDALVDTDFHPLVMERVLAALVWNPEPYRYWSDGSEHSHFQCRRARIISYGFNSCALHWNRQATLGCLDATLQRVHEMLGELDLNACAEAIGQLR